MEKKENKSPHGWFIILLIVFTLCIFLLTMVCSVEQQNVMIIQKLQKPVDQCTTSSDPKTLILTTPRSASSTPPTAVKMLRGGNVLRRHDKLDLINETLKRHLHSLPDVINVSIKDMSAEQTAYSMDTVSLQLHGYDISSLSVGKNFYIYDCNITTTPEYLVATVLMELPEIKIHFKDHPVYSEYCSTINPYIHVVELVYMWGYNKDTMETDDYMKLSDLKIYMVSWEDNLYRKSYEQVKNSPLYKVDIPMPLNIKKEELHDFIIKSGVLNNIAMAFTPTITLQAIQNNTPI
jgi:hypothetical protein